MRLIRFSGVLGLALGAMLSLSVPAQAAALGPWRQVAASTWHTCAINTGNSLYCWGNNDSGQIGNGTSGGNQLNPFRVAAAGVWSSVSAGDSHTCGITTAKNLYCWGNNQYGQIGNGNTSNTPQLSLYRVGAAGVWSSVSAGGGHTCGITTAKSLYCWGRSEFGQIGAGSNGSSEPTPLRVGAAGVWAVAEAGENHSCGVTTAKNLYCWGENGFGEIGKGTTGGTQTTLYRVAAAGVWATVSATSVNTCGITTAKNLYCWGWDDFGQVGDGTSGFDNNRPSPYRVAAAGVWATVSAGYGHTCGITTAANLYCWGNNGSGQIGNGIADGTHPALYRVAAAGVWARVAAGGSHTCGITTASNLYCWGNNDFGQIGNGSSGSNQFNLFRLL
jgi:alpha-tubulin suppressor-like RCC1 family protein